MSAPTAMHRLERQTFQTSRLLDFCSRRELINQTGHAVDQWPLVILKELVDNAIDAAEEAGTVPVINVEVEDSTIIVADNGPGIPIETVRGILDFSTRTSSREAYVSPTRGAQGNALKTILAMAYALDNAAPGETVIEAQGVAHKITFAVDPVRQVPKIAHTCASSPVTIGTRVTARWPRLACSKLADAERRFLQMAEDYDLAQSALEPSRPVEWPAAGLRMRVRPRLDQVAADPTRPARIGTTRRGLHA